MEGKLKEHHVYLLTYKLPTERKLSRAIMTYLAPARFGELYFNLRPVAGTQTLKEEWIVSAEDLGRTQGRDDKRHKARWREPRVGAWSND